MKYVTDNNEYGYFAEGEPTDAQLNLQDELDGITQEYLQALYDLHARVKGAPEKEVEHDIGKLFAVREEAERQLGLEDIYQEV